MSPIRQRVIMRFVFALLCAYFAIFAVVFLVLPQRAQSNRKGTQRICNYSALWGVAGEKWKPEGRIPDFSYAGYHAGEAKIPSPPVKWDLKRDFHASGDGRTDDSQALLNAIQSINSGVLFIPKGTYVISKRIDISKGNLILRGAGPND